MMQWDNLLSTKRLGRKEPRHADDLRSPFEIDVDRFVFCSAFRRLQQKMQVHGPSLSTATASFSVRNRLTHSIEASRAGRSLGQLAGQYLVGRGLVTQHSAADIGHIVSGAAIAHDIGQTPFSHEGEQAISSWWRDSALGKQILAGLPPAYGYELTRFEGNAFGFRLLSRLEGWQTDGGLQLTCAMLGAFAKYPWSGGLSPSRRPHPDKYGVFSSELALFQEVATETGLVSKGDDIWCRHPLAHLTEAADDICYLVVDIEDAVQIGVFPFKDAEALLAPLASIEHPVYDALQGIDRKLTYLRARAIATLIKATASVWQESHDRLLAGETISPLLDQTPYREQVALIKDISRSRIYRGSGRADTMLIAYRTLTVLLDHFAGMLLRRENVAIDRDLPMQDQAILSVVSRHRELEAGFPRDRAGWVREMMDHIASLTEPAAMFEAKLLTGGLPD